MSPARLRREARLRKMEAAKARIRTYLRDRTEIGVLQGIVTNWGARIRTGTSRLQRPAGCQLHHSPVYWSRHDSRYLTHPVCQREADRRITSDLRRRRLGTTEELPKLGIEQRVGERGADIARSAQCALGAEHPARDAGRVCGAEHGRHRRPGCARSRPGARTARRAGARARPGRSRRRTRARPRASYPSARSVSVAVVCSGRQRGSSGQAISSGPSPPPRARTLALASVPADAGAVLRKHVDLGPDQRAHLERCARRFVGDMHRARGDARSPLDGAGEQNSPQRGQRSPPSSSPRPSSSPWPPEAAPARGARAMISTARGLAGPATALSSARSGASSRRVCPARARGARPPRRRHRRTRPSCDPSGRTASRPASSRPV